MLLNFLISLFERNTRVDNRISLVRGDITKLAVDVIVNAANRSLLGGGGVDGAIHDAAGPMLLEECKTLCGCATGDVKITKGYDLLAKYVFHAVGPVWLYFSETHEKEDEQLANCYRKCLKLAVENNLKSIAFSTISTGSYGFPIDRACKIALKEVNEFLEKDTTLESVIFCCFDAYNAKAYVELSELPIQMNLNQPP